MCSVGNGDVNAKATASAAAATRGLLVLIPTPASPRSVPATALGSLALVRDEETWRHYQC